MTMSTRLAVMDKGRVQQVGTPREVYESPASRFVADFIGSVNLFAGRVLAADEAEAEVAIGDRDAVLRAASSTLWFIWPLSIFLSLSAKPMFSRTFMCG